MTVTPQVRKLETNANYGKFDIEPLDTGFRTTLGNTLRRVLLSSLCGAAVTSRQTADCYRLLIEVWTDGTMSPEEAVSHAASLFTQHLALFVRFGASIAEKEAKDRGATGGEDRLMGTPIQEPDLSLRAFNCLKANEIQTVGMLLQKREEDLLALRNFGRKSLDAIKEKLVQKGFIKPEEMGTVLRG